MNRRRTDKTDRQHNGQQKKDKLTTNYLHTSNITEKTKNLATRTPLKTGVNTGAFQE